MNTPKINRSIPVTEWQPIPTEVLRGRHGDNIFDSADLEERQVVDLVTYPLVNGAGGENPVFDVNGQRIPRREAIIEEGQAVNGMVFDLHRIHELFQIDDVPDRPGHIDDPHITSHYVYPMAGLRTLGHFQAGGLMTPFTQKLKELNTRVRQMYNQDDEDDIEADLLLGYSALIEGIASQGYNMLSHRVRSASRYHEVQVGSMTAAFAGTYHGSEASKNHAARFRDTCHQALPFERYHEKISGLDVDTSTRIENVYRVDIRRIPLAHRNGR